MIPGGGFCFAHISDPHLSDPSSVRCSQLLGKRMLGYLSWRRRRRHEHRVEVLDALRRDLSAQPIDKLLITGDLTHLGLPEEFAQARRWLDSLACPVAVVPGNHESYVAEPWEQTFARWLPYFCGDGRVSATSLDEIFPTLSVDRGVAFIGLATARPSPPFFATGRVGRVQLEKLAAVLADCREQQLFRVLWLHHPVITGQEKWRKRLEDAGDLMAVIAGQGVELILHGHSHRASQRQIDIGGRRVPVIGVPSASAMGWHGEMAHYNLLRVVASGARWLLSVDSRRLDREAMTFVSGASTALSIPL